ncbi:MAG TPA: hypothetical protein VH092_03480 [Urbifossiella sp.]|jgi:hypothetical protein|nr:hypothetical protein [Urbifossiella sp.]
MSEWVAQLLVQFPIVGIVLVAVVYATRLNDRRWKDFFREFRAASEAHRETVAEAIRRLDAVEGRMDARHNAELDRLKKEHDAHIRTLRTQLRRRDDRGGEPT